MLQLLVHRIILINIIILVANENIWNFGNVPNGKNVEMRSAPKYWVFDHLAIFQRVFGNRFCPKLPRCFSSGLCQCLQVPIFGLQTYKRWRGSWKLSVDLFSEHQEWTLRNSKGGWMALFLIWTINRCSIFSLFYIHEIQIFAFVNIVFTKFIFSHLNICLLFLFTQKKNCKKKCDLYFPTLVTNEQQKNVHIQ